MDTVTLLCSDGALVDLPRKHALMCEILRNLLEDSEGGENVPVPIAAAIVEKVKEFCVEYEGKPTTFTFETELAFRTTPYSGWMAAFVDVPFDTLAQMLEAANYLGLPMMVNITAKAVADTIAVSDQETILRLLDLPAEISAEEEARLCEEYPWLQEVQEVQECLRFCRRKMGGALGRQAHEQLLCPRGWLARATPAGILPQCTCKGQRFGELLELSECVSGGRTALF